MCSAEEHSYLSGRGIVILNTSSAYRDVRTTDNKEQQRYLPGAEKPSLPLRADPRIEFQEQRVDQASKHDADETDKTPPRIARRLERISQAPALSGDGRHRHAAVLCGSGTIANVSENSKVDRLL